MNWLTSLFDSSKIAGWVRAGVSGILTLVASKYLGDTVFKDVLSADFINAVSVAAATLVVGIWSNIAKSTAKS